jgi:nitroreductase
MKQIPLAFERLFADEMLRRSREFLGRIRTRRPVRMFAPDPVPEEVIENCIRAASRAPSGANQQPWRFVVVTDPRVKHQIRVAAEAEERENTPNPMGFLQRILDRPPNERPFLLIPAGYPAPGATVPDIAKKPLEDVLVRVR